MQRIRRFAVRCTLKVKPEDALEQASHALDGTVAQAKRKRPTTPLS